MADEDIEDLERIEQADDRVRALGEVFEGQRLRLRRMIEVRMDRRLRGRVDPSDVLQESFIEAAARLDAYLDDPGMPLDLWLRFLAGQQLVNHHRHHLGRQKRDAGRQRSLSQGAPQVTVALADLLVATGTTPTGAAVRSEQRQQLVDALEHMHETDREVIVLRHFEQLDNREVARVLELSTTAASNRYIRALPRLRSALATVGLLDPSSAPPAEG